MAVRRLGWLSAPPAELFLDERLAGEAAEIERAGAEAAGATSYGYLRGLQPPRLAP